MLYAGCNNSKFTSMANTPTYILYHGRNTGKDKDSKKIWTRIGAVWPNKSGKGFNLTWDYLPLGDGLTVMLPFDKEGGEVSPPEDKTSCIQKTRLMGGYFLFAFLLPQGLITPSKIGITFKWI